MRIRAALLATASVALAFGAGTARAHIAELRAGSFIQPNSITGKLFAEFAARVNEQGKGLLALKIVGPDAVPPFELLNAVKT